jgi:hypothetical protein
MIVVTSRFGLGLTPEKACDRHSGQKRQACLPYGYYLAADYVCYPQ